MQGFRLYLYIALLLQLYSLRCCLLAIKPGVAYLKVFLLTCLLSLMMMFLTGNEESLHLFFRNEADSIKI